MSTPMPGLGFEMIDCRYTESNPTCGEAETAAEFISWIKGVKVPLRWAANEDCGDEAATWDACSPPGFWGCSWVGLNTYGGHDCLIHGFEPCPSVPRPTVCETGLPIGTPWQTNPCQPRVGSEACALWIAVQAAVGTHSINQNCPPPSHWLEPQLSCEIVWNSCGASGDVWVGGTGWTTQIDDRQDVFESGCRQIAYAFRRAVAGVWLNIADGQGLPFEYDAAVTFEFTEPG